jgi:hypothetical protein
MIPPIIAMVDRACGFTREPPEPSRECMCGALLKRNEKCPTPERCAILRLRLRVSVCCNIPGTTRKECGDARSLKTGCRCYCHTRLPEEKVAERLFFWVVKWAGDYLGAGFPTWKVSQKEAVRMSRAKALFAARPYSAASVVRVRRKP